MALRNLVEGQCGEGNALVKLTHHVSQDKRHRDDLSWRYPLSGDANDNIHGSFGGSFSGNNLVEEFMHETQKAAVAAPKSFRMDALLQEMHEIESMRSCAPPTLAPGVADLASDAGMWAEQYMDNSKLEDVNSRTNWSSEFFDGHRSEFLDVNFDPGVDERSENASSWVQQYNPEEDKELAQTANELLGTVDDPKFSNTKFMQFVRTLGGNTESKGQGWANEYSSEPLRIGNQWTNEFVGSENINPVLMSNKSKGNSASSDARSQKWTNEFQEAKKKGTFEDVHIDSDIMSENEREAFWDNLKNVWESNSEDHPWLSDYQDQYPTDTFQEYKFSEENALLSHPDPLGEGKRCLAVGDLPSAILFFEAAVQQDEQNAEGWKLLGTTHAQNEQDVEAIAALSKSVQIDPSSLESWMSLATSYTNESYQAHACNALKEWILNNKEYSHLAKRDEKQSPIHTLTIASPELIEEVRNMYIEAANQRPSAGPLDVDVQSGLGVLLNLSGKYDMAIDCFQAALGARTNDAQLWNKLGATLANSNRSAEAIDAYRRALEISPGFIRCRYNLGIACMNLNSHREAMEHFLEALNVQEKTGQHIGNGRNGHSLVVSDNIWTTLTTCLHHLNMKNLRGHVDSRNLEALNRAFGIVSTS